LFNSFKSRCQRLELHAPDNHGDPKIFCCSGIF